MASLIRRVNYHHLCIFAAALCLLVAQHSIAGEMTGRLEGGVLTSTERFVDETSGSDKNDEMVGSFRFFQRVIQLNDSAWDFTSDFRDRYNLFDKLNKEKLQLDPSNTFQVRQLNVMTNQSRGPRYGLGRFSVSEAGGDSVDGGLVGYVFDSSWSTGLFSGLTPRLAGQNNFAWNPNAMTTGSYLTYQAKGLNWDKNFYLTHGLSHQTFESEVDRQYLFHSSAYQWSKSSRLFTLLYLDFVPRTYVQVGDLYWQQEISSRFLSKLNLLGIDSLQYVHRQDVREKLDPAPYKEASLRFDYLVDEFSTWELEFLVGLRESDQLQKKQSSLSYASQRIFGPKWDFSAKVISRENFLSDDQTLRTTVGYYSRVWEASFSVEAGVENQRVSGVILHPLVLEAMLARFFDRDISASWTIERASDERVLILSSFLKVGYRFGSRELPPLRDGSPVKGPL